MGSDCTAADADAVALVSHRARGRRACGSGRKAGSPAVGAGAAPGQGARPNSGQGNQRVCRRHGGVRDSAHAGAHLRCRGRHAAGRRRGNRERRLRRALACSYPQRAGTVTGESRGGGSPEECLAPGCFAATFDKQRARDWRRSDDVLRGEAPWRPAQLQRS